MVKCPVRPYIAARLREILQANPGKHATWKFDVLADDGELLRLPSPRAYPEIRHADRVDEKQREADRLMFAASRTTHAREAERLRKRASDILDLIWAHQRDQERLVQERATTERNRRENERSGSSRG